MEEKEMLSLREKPGYWSTRVQRANRTNGIERAQLSDKLALLERQRTRQIRLTNQDMRLVSLSLQYIRASSGESPQSLSDLVSICGDKAPCFMYGERIATRNKPRNTQSRVFSKIGRKTVTGINNNVLNDDEVDGADSKFAIISNLDDNCQHLNDFTETPPTENSANVVMDTKGNTYEETDRVDSTMEEKSSLCGWEDMEPSVITKRLFKKQSCPIEKHSLYENESTKYAKTQAALISRVLRTQATLENLGNEDTTRALSHVGDMSNVLSDSRVYVMTADLWSEHVRRAQKS